MNILCERAIFDVDATEPLETSGLDLPPEAVPVVPEVAGLT